MDFDNPKFWIIVAPIMVVIIILCALDSAERERNFKPRTPQEYSSGATPDDTNETEW